MVGIAAIVLGILALTTLASWVLVLVGFIAIGAALLMVSATFSGAVTRLLVGAA
jgi:membrane protein implicated in regulation of membrane protease activity